MIKTYFNYVYNPIYDFTTAKLTSYEKLQTDCIDKLDLKNGERVLCVGVGTGNEIIRIFQDKQDVDIVGIDYSPNALKKLMVKTSAKAKQPDSCIMDAHNLGFEANSFDKVLCIHVIDFLSDHEKAAGELFRVLKDDGQFVITYPSEKEGIGLGIDLFRQTVRHRLNSNGSRIRNIFGILIQMFASILYLPMLLRTKRKSYKLDELQEMLGKYPDISFQVEQFDEYRDFVVYGNKKTSRRTNR